MQHTEGLADLGVPNRAHFDAIASCLGNLNRRTETLAEVAHDARNMVAALDLYCDLLREPGVLALAFSHYGDELKLVASASRSLVEKLSSLSNSDKTNDSGAPPAAALDIVRDQVSETFPLGVHATSVENLAEELLANRNMLAAIAGPFVALTVDTDGGELPVRLTAEDLTRILVNLVKNATEAMGSVGRIRITLAESFDDQSGVAWLTLRFEDNGPGIADRVLEKIFEPGESTRVNPPARPSHTGWQARRGLGLSITRSIVEAAGGRIQAANRDPVGACFQIHLPVRRVRKEL